MLCKQLEANIGLWYLMVPYHLDDCGNLRDLCLSGTQGVANKMYSLAIIGLCFEDCQLAGTPLGSIRSSIDHLLLPFRSATKVDIPAQIRPKMLVL